ncbi:hypothetical protein EON68_00605 [archaeon]|nr:MAG: hypothetical protein EON68_00605 [archaeon]
MLCGGGGGSSIATVLLPHGRRAAARRTHHDEAAACLLAALCNPALLLPSLLRASRAPHPRVPLCPRNQHQRSNGFARHVVPGWCTVCGACGA